MKILIYANTVFDHEVFSRDKIMTANITGGKLSSGWTWLKKDKVINRFLEISRDLDFVMGGVKIELTSKEKEQILFYQFYSKRSIRVKEIEKDRLFEDVVSQMNPVDLGGVSKVRILDGVSVQGKIGIDDSSFFNLIDSDSEILATDHYLNRIGGGIRGALSKSKVGVSESGDNVYLVKSKFFAPSVCVDASLSKDKDDEAEYIQTGLLGFDGLTGSPAIMRQVESLGANYTPCWIVNKDVKKYLGSISKGRYSFVPVFDTSQDIYKRYIDKMNNFMDLVNVNPKNSFQIWM